MFCSFITPISSPLPPVKGLDYALLQKVRSEITSIESEESSVAEASSGASAKEKETTASEKPKPSEKTEEKIEFRTVIGRKIYQVWVISTISRGSQRAKKILMFLYFES